MILCFRPVVFMLLLMAGIPSVLRAQDETTHTIYFSIPSKGTNLENQIFRQIVDGVALQEEDTSRYWQLYQEVDQAWIPRPSQIQKGESTLLYGLFSDTENPGEAIQFKWKQEKGKPSPGIRIIDSGKSLTFMKGGVDIVSYRYVFMPSPEGIPEIFGKSGFIHPLKTPSGNILSRIQPPDHFHHYGMWQPWTQTEYRGETIDFWNLGEGQGTVVFSDILNVTEGPLFSEITVIQNHNIHPGRGAQTVLKETVTYRVWNLPAKENYYILDVLYHMSPATVFPLTIKAYRYQGFSLRGPAHWNDQNVQLLTSTGKNKSDGNSTRARWMKVTGPGDQSDISTVIMMTNPANYNFPEQIRIWPTGTNGGKENVFINFNPAQDRDWEMKPGNTYTLQYRVIAADKDFPPETLHQMWAIYSGAASE